MDLDEQDDVLMARLCVYSTPGLHHASSEEPGPLRHSPPVRSSVPDDVTSPNPHSKLAPVPVDEFTETEGRIDVSDDETSVNDENVEPTNTGTTNTVEPNVHNDFQLGIQQSPEISRRMGKKFQQNRRNITTKTGRKKIPSNIPSVPIDEISFYLEENVQ
ncbi:uncharacterized protein E5676_scaffold83G00980 [Cucumis melo var. makuwa]|uniref:Envelope-like protein n=1 Tax=Cucumis melo var. makuwa TaxID=1194695 RepID=A0A5D3C226_CUCMM|nr:uncharacterized protein E5676_scaffold83G00980 [Cucumis melo var. makuwa]